MEALRMRRLPTDFLSLHAYLRLIWFRIKLETLTQSVGIFIYWSDDATKGPWADSNQLGLSFCRSAQNCQTFCVVCCWVHLIMRAWSATSQISGHPKSFTRACTNKGVCSMDASTLLVRCDVTNAGHLSAVVNVLMLTTGSNHRTSH